MANDSMLSITITYRGSRADPLARTEIPWTLPSDSFKGFMESLHSPSRFLTFRAADGARVSINKDDIHLIRATEATDAKTETDSAHADSHTP